MGLLEYKTKGQHTRRLVLWKGTGRRDLSFEQSHEAFWETSRRNLAQKFKLVWICATSRMDQSPPLDFEAKMASSHDGTCT